MQQASAQQDSQPQDDAYAQAGVNIAAGQKAVDLMASAVRATYGPEVLAGIGSFGGLYDATKLKNLAAPVLVASTDGVGTKTKVAAKLGRWDTIGRDLVHHCVNDILVQGARPLFFLDYVASARIAPEQIAALVTGVAVACQDVGCALLGGETAEMPGVYLPNEVDLAGTIVGVVDRAQLLDGSRIEAGDVIIGLPSTGLHTNGYTLARALLDSLSWTATHPTLNGSIGEALLQVHRCYLKEIQQLWAAGLEIHGLAHITGGGITDNLPRILPPGLSAAIQLGTWPVLPIFDLIQQVGEVPLVQMLHVFNMGLGMLIILPANQAAQVQATLADRCYRVGEIVRGQTGVQYV
ncbi:MAG: phosphoribosylformylglycinamidine cyclo-ligase [Chloroflexi bacterium]|nr:phosphoribosylformylglycinamidine cyclo-ligase [Chloroflexota bacterium]